MSPERRCKDMGSPDDYEIHEQIGRGGFATVYKAIRKEDRAIVAIKKIIKRLDYGEREVKVMKDLTADKESRQRIVPLLDYYRDEKYLYLVMPYYRHGTLRDYIRKSITLPMPTIIHILKQLIYSIRYLHEKQYAHRDISTGNILISNIRGESVYVLISDMGLTKIINGQAIGTTVGTHGYMHPKVAEHKKYGLEVDIFSLGAVLFSMLTGEDPPRHEDSKKNINEMIQKTSAKYPGDATDLLKKMLSIDKPIGLTEIHSHPFVMGVPGSSIVPRSCSRECRHVRINENGNCSKCDVNFDKENFPIRRQRRESQRDSAIASGDYDNLRPKLKRSASANAIDRNSKLIQHRKTKNIQWPIPVFSHLAPHILVKANKGRFIVKEDRLIFERAIKDDSDIFVDVVMEVVRLRGEDQCVLLSTPRDRRPRLRGEKDPPIDTCPYFKRYDTPYLSSEHVSMYDTIIKSISVISGRAPKIDYVNMFNIHHLQGKLMYNGDLRIIFPVPDGGDNRVFVLDGRTKEIKGFGGATGKSMTMEEKNIFEKVKDLIFAIDNACVRAMGPLYRRQTMVGQRNNFDDYVQIPISYRTDKFETATFATREGHMSGPVSSRKRSESARRAK